ncbi:MAG TPA: hypothetical protein VFE58_18340 [Tepidisphaeraceae bacterium]|jgi:hypothetical protein|nr:hypothetical protein [Tepidisphaeraceae bacterium]
MGRTELPDPLEKPAANAGGTDDLLSQLAGDEIDRMLAEAEVESAAAPKVEHVEGLETPAEVAPVVEETTAATSAEDPALAAQLNEVFNELQKPIEENSTAAASETPTADATAPVAPGASELDTQLEKLAQELLPTAAPEEAMTTVDAPVAEAAPVVEAKNERAALLAESAEGTIAEEGLEQTEAGPVPWYVKPLIWINAPFASFSEQAMDLMGKVALATLLFSITVLAFVVMTRHRL